MATPLTARQTPWDSNAPIHAHIARKTKAASRHEAEAQRLRSEVDALIALAAERAAASIAAEAQRLRAQADEIERRAGRAR
jgi:hypothetical protein